MLLSLSELEDAISPVELVDRFRLSHSRDSGCITINCPFCASLCWVLRRGFLCQNNDCPMQAGSIFEIAMGVSEPKRYRAGLEVMRQKFARRLEAMPAYQSLDFVDHAEGLLLTRRRLMRLLRGTQRNSNLCGSHAHLISVFQKQGMLNPGGHLVGVLAVSQQDELQTVLSDMGLQGVSDLPERDLLISIYWKSVHEPAAVVLLDPVKRWQTLLEFGSYGMAVCGLHMLTPRVKAAHLHSSPFAAGCKNAQWVRQDLQCASVAFLMGDADSNPLEVDSCVMHWTSDMLITSATRAMELQPALQFCLGDSDRLVTYPRMLFDMVAPHIRGGLISRAGLDIVGQANPAGEVKAALIEMLGARHMPKAVEQLTNGMYNILLAKSDRTEVYQTPTGYAVRKSRSMEAISNFVLQPDYHVSFGAHHTPHLELTVRLGSSSFKALLPPRLLDSPKDLTDALGLRASVSGAPFATPLIRDTKAFSLAVSSIKSKTGALPVKVGLPFLGWAFDGSQFFAPGLKVGTDSGTHAVSMPFYPEATLLDSFDPGVVAESDLPVAGMSEDERKLLVLLVGALLRGYRSEQHHVVSYQHDSNSRSLFEAAFRGLGQTRPAQAAQVTPDHVHGYPVWVQNARKDSKSRMAAFTLQASGVSVKRPASKHLTGGVRRVMRLAVEAIMAAPDLTWEAPKGVTYESMVMAEATSFMRQHMHVDACVAPARYDWLEHVLQRTKLSEINDVVTYEFEAQRTVWNVDKFVRDDSDKMTFEHELRSLMDGVMSDGKRIMSPAAETIDMLSLYYGAPPRFDVKAPQ